MNKGKSKKRKKMGEKRWSEYQKERNLKKSKEWNNKNKHKMRSFKYFEDVDFSKKKIKDIYGLRSGMLVAVRPYGRDTKQNVILWECKCDCGNYSLVRTSKITGGSTTSCGCMQNGSKKMSGYQINKPILKPRESIGDMPMWYFNQIKYNAEKRDLEFNLSPEYLDKLYKEQNRQCALSGIDLNFYYGENYRKTTASLDRIDNDKGYIIDNVQWTHKDINKLRGKDSIDVFIKKCKMMAAVVNHLKLQ